MKYKRSMIESGIPIFSCLSKLLFPLYTSLYTNADPMCGSFHTKTKVLIYLYLFFGHTTRQVELPWPGIKTASCNGSMGSLPLDHQGSLVLGVLHFIGSLLPRLHRAKHQSHGLQIPITNPGWHLCFWLVICKSRVSMTFFLGFWEAARMALRPQEEVYSLDYQFIRKDTTQEQLRMGEMHGTRCGEGSRASKPCQACCPHSTGMCS